MKKWIFVAFIFTIGMVLSACGGDDSAEETENEEETTTEQTEETENEEEATTKQTEETENEEEATSEQSEQAQGSVEVTEEEKVDEDTAVVDINGTEITGNKYNTMYSQVKTLINSYGQDTSDQDMLKDQTIAVLVEQELIKQDASDKGIEVTEEETQEELNTMIEQVGEEQYQAVLDQTQLTEDEFKNQLQNDLITQKYIDEEIEYEITDEEIEENYELLKENNEELGELEEVEGQIRELLSQQKETEQLQAKLEDLRENAEIETLI